MSILLTILLFLAPILIFLLHKRRRLSKRLPPGPLGLPYIGQSHELLKAMKNNTAEIWLEERAKKYGPVSKMTLFGTPTVFVCGQAGNKFVFTNDGGKLCNKQNTSARVLMGERNLIELSGEDHKRVRNALASFLKPDCLKIYVGKAQQEVRRHIKMHWEGKQQVTVYPLMKTLAFNVMCTCLFDMEHGGRRDELLRCFDTMTEGLWSLPINLPFTQFNRSLQASQKLQKMLKDLLDEKRVGLQKGASPHQDFITYLASLRGEDGKDLLTEDEIIHSLMVIMIGGHDTSSVLITFVLKRLAIDPKVYQALLKEQVEIAKSKSPGELLTWEDLTKMAYTWRVGMETLRLYPPAFGTFRKTTTDVEFGGYLIPKGWQVLWVAAMTHMDNSIFNDPTKFEPARWENLASIPPYTFVAFGSGARVCPGTEFAKLQSLLAIHCLATQFTWKLLFNDNFASRSPALIPTQGLPIEITPIKVL